MTYVIGVRCDICGQLHVAEYTGQVHQLPEGWASITVNYTHIENGPTHQMREICEECAKALESGESVEIYKQRKEYAQLKRELEKTGPMVYYPDDMTPVIRREEQ